MVAFHYPPTRGSSGIQRTLRFAKYLPEFGWQPIVLTAHPRAYAEPGVSEPGDDLPGVHVCRAFALDTKRHLAIGRKYPGFLARPDRWRTWWLGGVPAGMRLIRKFAPHALWSTYPIPTAHVIAGTLQRMTRLPWIADFRDPMAQEGYPRDPRTWSSFKSVEERAVERAARLVFTTPGAQRIYRERYADMPAERFALIENGYDEESFAGVDTSDRSPLNPGMLTLLHSGIVYPEERDPTELMRGLAILQSEGAIAPGTFRVRFRAPVHGELIAKLAREAGVEPLVEILPSIPYRQAIQEMMRADALLLLQAANCNQQIPAKAYEYFRTGRPIVALTDPAGDTAETMRRAGCANVAPLDDARAIADLLRRWVRGRDHDVLNMPSPHAIDAHSRRSRTAELARMLDSVA